MSEINNALRTKLYNWRMANNLSQREAAISLGVQQAQIWKWESGKITPRAHTLDKILPIIDKATAPVEKPEPVEELWVPELVEPKRPLTFRERMEQRHGGPEEYFKKTFETAAPDEDEPEVELVAELPLESHAEPTPSLFSMAMQQYEARAIAEARASAEAKASGETHGITKLTHSLVKLTKVIGFLECLALYAAEGVAEPLEKQIKTLQDIAEEMSA